MVKRQAEPSVTVGPEGVTLTPFANEICLQEDLEVSLVSLPVTVNDIRFPMCLVAASVGRHKAVRPRTDGVPVWPLHEVPSAMMQCSVEMPSGHTLFPFADSPHITQEGFIIHGSNPETRAKIYRLLLHREIISNPREAAREVLDHLQWIWEDDAPVQIFLFRALQHLEHWPISPPAKRRAALWLTPQPEGPLMPRAVPHFEIFQRPPQGRAGIYAAHVSPADMGELPLSATFPVDCLEYETPFLCLAKEATRRLPFIKKAASTLCDLIRECPLLGDGSVQRQAYRVVHDILQEMHELEEALGQLQANSDR